MMNNVNYHDDYSSQPSTMLLDSLSISAQTIPIEGKRRKSKFDVLPSSAISVVNEEIDIDLPNSLKHNVKYEDEFHDSNIVWMESVPSSSSKILSVPEQNLHVLYAPVEDFEFRLKIQKAMEKNFEYIERMDRIAAECALNGTPMPKMGQIHHKSRFEDKFNKPKPVEKKGIGIVQEVAKQPAKVESTRVYVSGLPKDITEEEIEILFGPQGKIKKIKIYVDKEGKKKGDALVTYASSEGVIAACARLHRLNIGEGHILSVTKAEFSSKEIPAPDTQTTSPPAAVTLEEKILYYLNGLSDNDPNLYEYLPEESEAKEFPVVFIWNAYDIQETDLIEIETELLIKACEYGTVKIIQLFDFALRYPRISPNEPNGVDDNEEEIPLGAAAITFEDVSAARICQQRFHRLKFNERELFSKILIPPAVLEKEREEEERFNQFMRDTRAEDPVPVITNIPTEGKPLEVGENPSYSEAHKQPEEQEIVYDESIQREVESVEDFLNSLL